MKCHKFSVKLYVQAESDGLAHRFILLADNKDVGVGGVERVDKLALKRMSDIESVHLLFMDN